MGISRFIGRMGEFLREFDRGLAVGYGHERPKRGRKLRGPEICRRLDHRFRKARERR